MPKDKAESSSQPKVKVNNGTSKQILKKSSNQKNEEVKKSRELSTDRSNVKKSLTGPKTVSTKKIESSRSKTNDTPTPKSKSVELSTDRTNVKKSLTGPKTVSTKNIDSLRSKTDETPKSKTVNSVSNTGISKITTSKTVTKTTGRDKKLSVSNVTPRTTLLKSTAKPAKSLSTTSTTVNSWRTTTDVPLKGTKSSSRDVTSKRVTKEQYFPKKYPYSSYLHENEEQLKSDRKSKDPVTKTSSFKKVVKEENVPPKKLSRERTMTRVLSPSEVQVIKNIVEESNNNKSSPEISISSDIRPRTATIRKHDGSENLIETTQLVMSNPDKNFAEPAKESQENVEENDYEDDFDSYESDFEVYSSASSSPGSIETNSTSSESSSSSSEEQMIEFTQKRTNSAGNEEERKLDSGNYDLPDMKHKQILDKIKEAVEKENSNITKHISGGDAVSNLGSLSDEGFEDGSKHSLVNTGFINFLDAKKKQKLKKISLKSRKRGDDLMGMIRLNNVSFTLFDMNAISYDDFMQNYGKTGTIQMSSQTGDDDIDEEIQTETIEMISKSTQFPVRFSKKEEYFPSEHDLNTENEINWNDNTKTKQLNKFLETTGRLVMHILEHKQIKTEQTTKKNERELPFSDGYFSLNFDNVPFLKNRTVSHMSYSKYSKLLTIHESNIQIYMDQNDQLLSRSTICIWDISEPTYPLNILVSAGEITNAIFDSNHGFLVFAGICDGSVSVWDLRENPKLHRIIYDEPTNKSHIMRSPTYTTVTTVDGEQNASKIISIQSYYEKIYENISDLNCQQNISGIQVATLEETGLVVIWSVIQKQATPELLSEDQGLIPWGCVILIQGLTISLQKLNPNLKELQCSDFQFSETDFNHLFIASNYGILHCLTSGMKPKPKIYSSVKSSVNCVEMAPFSTTHFLAGCENGNIKLHSRFYEKPLMTLCSTEEQTKLEENIQLIEWSNNRPCVFFVKDKANNIHIWDLASSDMYPIYSVPFSEDISDIKFLSSLNNNQSSYMAIASKKYGVRIHTVSKEFSQITPEQYKTELNIFLNYANRL